MDATLKTQAEKLAREMVISTGDFVSIIPPPIPRFDCTMLAWHKPWRTFDKYALGTSVAIAIWSVVRGDGAWSAR